MNSPWITLATSAALAACGGAVAPGAVDGGAPRGHEPAGSDATAPDAAPGTPGDSASPGPMGTECSVDSDCMPGFCTNGVCHCLPGGATFRAYGDCCSGSFRGSQCFATKNSPCTTQVPDCFGASCSGGFCACVGVGGDCQWDTDCCAGATRCSGNGYCQ